MILDLSDSKESKIASQLFNKLILDKRLIDLKQVKKTRSNLQNKSLHLFFRLISDELNELGLTFNYIGLKGLEMDLRYTPDLVKITIWKPIQKALFNTDSTKDLDSYQLNEVSETIIKFFAEKGISLIFPNIQSLIDQEDERKTN